MNNYNFKHQQRMKKLRNRARMNDKKRRIKNKKRKYMLYYIFFTLILLTTTTILSLTVFFKIESIEIKSQSKKFTSKQILKQLNIDYGDNLILVDSNKLIKKLLTSFPSLSNATVKKIFPNTIQINCQFDGPIFALETENNELFGMSKSGRLVNKYNNINQCKNLMHLKIETKTFKIPQLGHFLTIDKQEQQILNTLITSIQKTNLKNITKIEIKHNFELVVTYADRIKIEIKKLSQIERLISASNKIITEFIGNNKKGRICYFEKNNTIHFIPEIEILLNNDNNDNNNDDANNPE